MMTYYEMKDALDWLFTTVRKHDGILSLDVNFLTSFKETFDIAYDEPANDFKELLAELRVKNVDAVTFFMIENEIVKF